MWTEISPTEVLSDLALLLRLLPRIFPFVLLSAASFPAVIDVAVDSVFVAVQLVVSGIAEQEHFLLLPHCTRNWLTTAVGVVWLSVAVEELPVSCLSLYRPFSILEHEFEMLVLVGAVRKPATTATWEVKEKTPGGNWKKDGNEILIVDISHKLQKLPVLRSVMKSIIDNLLNVGENWMNRV
jgi:hypothetical protein